MSSAKQLIDGKGGFQFCYLVGLQVKRVGKCFKRQQKKILENKTTSSNKKLCKIKSRIKL
jgi:hypothetical protein